MILPAATQTNQILGTLLIELLQGRLTDEMIEAVDSIRREDTPESLRDLVGMIHGMSTEPKLRHDITGMLIDEIRAVAHILLEDKFWAEDDPRRIKPEK